MILTKICSLLEWCSIISIDTRWDWFQHTYVVITARKFITALANCVVLKGVSIIDEPDFFLGTLVFLFANLLKK